MATRNNAMSELVKFWLEARCGCLVKESIPVKLKRNYSDIDLLAMKPDSKSWELPAPYNGVFVERAIIETKDEHDFDKRGTDFGKRLEYDVNYVGFGNEQYTPADKYVHFSMLRKQHYDIATQLFEGKDFHRIFVVHNIKEDVRKACEETLSSKNIYFLTIREIVKDLKAWYNSLDDKQRNSDYDFSKAQLRNSLTGDIWHLLIGYCLEEIFVRDNV